MIGIIVCVIVLAIIVILSCPGFISVLLVSAICYLSLYWLLGLFKEFVIDPWLERRKRNKYLKTHNVDYSLKSDFDVKQQEAIDEWEKKWKKKHPLRIKKKS